MGDQIHSFWLQAGSINVLFNWEAVYLFAGTVFLVKCEIPAMILDQTGLSGLRSNRVRRELFG